MIIDRRRRARLAMLSAIGITAAFCCIGIAATAFAESTWRPDAWVTAKTKIALATDGDVEATDVNVDTVNGHVTLHGKVPSAEAKSEAEKIARGIDGAVDVRNLLQVVPDEKMDKTDRQDADIQKAVDEALDSDAELKSSSIDVQSVNDGVVLLSGSADSTLAHLEAIRTASAVEGVRRVESEVVSDDRLYDEKVWRDPDLADDQTAAGYARKTGDATAEAGKATGNAIANAGKATANAVGDAGRATADAVGDAADTVAGKTKDAAEETVETTKEVSEDARDATADAASSTSGAMRDAWITTATKTRLLADPDTPALSINVDTDDGVVTLFGTVPSEQAREEAIAHAKAVSGTVEVRDQLTIDAGAVAGDSEAERPTDDQLAERVRAELKSENEFEHAKIEVEVDDGIAQLSGTAPSGEIRMAAATTARSVDGVRAVQNNIRVAPTSL